MKRKAWLMRLIAVLMVLMMILSACAFAEAAVQVSDAARAACQSAGGKLLAAPRAVTVVSPYGTQSVVLRNAPSNSYDAVAMLRVGQGIALIGTSGSYCFVLLEDGGMGWLAEDEVK